MDITPERDRIHRGLGGRKEIMPSEAEIAEECRKILAEREAKGDPHTTKTVDFSRPHRIYVRRRR